MACGTVTVDTADGVGIRRASPHELMDQVAVALETVGLQDSAVGLGDQDGFAEILEGEGFGVVPAVLGLGQVFADEVVWQVAVHTGGRGVMARLLPGIELRFHDVAVHTGPRVFAEVRNTLPIVQGEASHTEENPQHGGHEGGFLAGREHGLGGPS